MAKARRVPGIKPRGSLEENARRIISFRLDEVLSWRRALEDASLVQDLHNMRIAFKRLRYALEMFDVCFPDGKPLVKRIGDIQDQLGDIHDLDVLADIFRRRLRTMESRLEEEAIAVMSGEAKRAEKNVQLRRMLQTNARDQRYLGMIGLIADKVAERRRRYEEIQRSLGLGGLDELADEVRRAIQPTDHQEDQGDVDQPTGVSVAGA